MDKSKLFKVLGVVTFVGSIVVLILQFVSENRRHFMSERFESGMAKLKSELPKKIDDKTTAVDVDYERHLGAGDREWVNLTYKYVVDLSADDTPFDLHETEQSVQQQACADPNTSRAIKAGNSFSFHYASKQGVSLGDFTISACP